MKKIAEQINKESMSLNERGLHNDSFFHVTFHDGSEIKEHDASWSDFSEEVVVDWLGGMRLVSLSRHHIAKIEITHGGKTAVVTAEKDERVYQSVRSQATHHSDGSTETKVIGRVVGKVKNGKIVEEKFIDSRTGEVLGIRI